MTEFSLNGKTVRSDTNASTPLLWVLRDHFRLKGTKFGCGLGLCGACTVHLDGQPVRSCVLPLAAVSARSVTTIEGIGTPEAMSLLQQSWVQHSVPQCGYCQSGQIMSAAALLRDQPEPSDEDINQAMSGNLCRCGSYAEIRLAIKAAARQLQAGGSAGKLLSE